MIDVPLTSRREDIERVSQRGHRDVLQYFKTGLFHISLVQTIVIV